MQVPVLEKSANLRYFSFFYLYIMQGIPAGFALTALSNYLLAQDVGPQQVGTFIAFVGLPWTLQFVWGPLIDRYQYSAMGRRKQWMVAAQWLAIAASLCLLMVADPKTDLRLMTTVFFFHSIFASVQVASVDAMAISISPVDERGRLNGFMRGGFLIGIAFGSAVLSVVMHRYGFHFAVILQAGILGLFSLLFFFTRLNANDQLLPWGGGATVRIRQDAPNPSFRDVFRRVYSGITNRVSLQYFIIVAVVYFCSSVFVRSYTFHLIHVLHWTDKAVSVLQGGWGSIVTFVAIIVAGIVSDKTGAKSMQIRVMWAVCIFLILLNASFALWRFEVYSGAGLVLWNLADPLLSVAVFPILMGLCLDKVEGSQFTTYLALINLCDVIGSYITGWALQFVPAPVLGLSCGCLLLCVMISLRLRDRYRQIPESAKQPVGISVDQLAAGG